MDLQSGRPFWPLRDGLIASYPPLERDASADVAVIGAGITGALVARLLADAGADVIVLDKRDVASGSTAATSGLLMYQTDTSLGELSEATGEANAVRVWRLGIDAIDQLEEIIESLGDRCGFDRRSCLYVASSRWHRRQLHDEYERRARHGFDVEWLESTALAARYGIRAPAAIHARANGQVDCYRLTHRLLQSLAARGVRIFDRTSVEHTANNSDDDIVITTDRGAVVHTRKIVWAAGYEGVEETQRRVGKMHSTWVLATEPLADPSVWPEGILMWETARPYLYARLTDDGRVMAGGEDEPFSRRHAKAPLMKKKTSRLLKRLATFFPNLVVEAAYEWAGVFSTTKDGLPYIGPVKEHPGAWIAMGYGGNGITFSTIAAQLIRDAWLGVANDDAKLFGFDR